MNILKPKAKLIRIYPIFHFIPGDPRAPTAWRKDGGMHWLNTTPNSKNANMLMDAALASKTKDLHRIGIAVHGYVDSWAHQNFVGYHSAFNAMSGPLGTFAPNIGHADAGHNPDEPALVWQDLRLKDERVDNKTRFLEAAECLLQKLLRFADPSVSQKAVKNEGEKLRKDLDTAIGARDRKNERREERIARYKELGSKRDYGGRDLPEYDEDKWFDEAVNEDARGLRDRSDFSLTRWDPLTDKYTWKDARNYTKTNWYRFQEAVKQHQDDSWDRLSKRNLKGLDLPEL